MSRQDGKVIRPFEYCLEKSKLALEDKLIPELRQEIIHKELLPDKVWREAKRRLRKLRSTADLGPEDEALATSYWWLAKTKRDHRERFEKEISPPSPSGYGEAKEEKEMGEKIVITLHHDGIKLELDDINAVRVCNEILVRLATSNKIIERFKIMPEFTNGWMTQNDLRNSLIQILVEKYGLDPFIEVLEKRGIKVKICGNCKCFTKQDYDPVYLDNPDVGICAHDGRKILSFDYQACERDGEEHWAPKEASEEISRKAYCPKCDKEVEVKIKRGANPLTANCPECHGEIRLRSGCGAKL